MEIDINRLMAQADRVISGPLCEVQPDKHCYICQTRDAHICIVCERTICKAHIAPDILLGDHVICVACDKITPNREQASAHFWIRVLLREKKEKARKEKEENDAH